MKFASATGWRTHSEVLPLEMAQRHWGRRRVRLDAHHDKERRGPVVPDLETILNDQLAIHETLKKSGRVVPFVFHRNGERIKEFRTAWKNACKAAGCPGKLIHDMRRSAVRTFERAGVPRSVAVSIVGHKTESIYRRYAIVDEAMQREAAARLDAWMAAPPAAPWTATVTFLRRGSRLRDRVTGRVRQSDTCSAGIDAQCGVSHYYSATSAGTTIITPVPRVALTLGARLGPYEVAALIGVGGMGEVYQATDTNLKRQVAIKILPEALARDPDRLARFQREAEVLAALNHPNIAHIHGLERSDERTVLVMELVAGPTLADRIAHGAIPVEEALPIAKQIAEALESAHEQGIVHRDLKPANVKLRGDGTVKVLDFGLAKALVPVGAISPGVAQSPTITSSAMMTGVGMLLGTAAYMSPEQARGKVVDKRADIWSFGCVLFEMLTGQRAFPGDDITDTIASVVKTEPDWHRLPTELPVRVRRVLRVCLDKDPRKRGGDISAIRLALDGVFEPDAPTEAPGRPAGSGHRRSTVLPWSIAAGALIAAAAMAGLWLRPSPPPEVIRYQIQAPAGSRLPFGTPAVSPDGRTLAYVVEGPDGVGRIHICPIDRIEARVLQGTEGARHPFWAPDGHALAFAADGYVKRVDLAGGVPQTLARTGAPWQGAWNQRDEILFLGGGVSTGIAPLQLQRIAARGGQPSPVRAEGTFRIPA